MSRHDPNATRELTGSPTRRPWLPCVIFAGEGEYRAVAAAGGLVYLVGDQVLQLGATAPITLGDYAPWAAAIHGGALYLSDHHSVRHLQGGMLVDTDAPPDTSGGGASHNHCLVSVGDSLYFARRDDLLRLRDSAWTTLEQHHGQ
jgi:hypothetical protein